MATIFKNESKIKAIGGRLENEYYIFRKSVLFANANYFPLFFMMGINDKDLIIDTILSDNTFEVAAKGAYIEHITRMIENGEFPIDSLLTKKALSKEMPTPEEKERQIKSAIHRALLFRFNTIYNAYVETYKPSTFGVNKIAFNICRETLSLNNLGFEINVDKFISFYQERIRAEETELHKLHKKAADAINKFFGGSLEITLRELARYFIIKSGLVKPNPKSINIDDYTRLGIR